jgi:hypothetical protein
MQSNPMKKGKTMTPKTVAHVIWDFQVRVFNIGRRKVEQKLRERAQKEERWLNG